MKSNHRLACFALTLLVALTTASCSQEDKKTHNKSEAKVAEKSATDQQSEAEKQQQFVTNLVNSINETTGANLPTPKIVSGEIPLSNEYFFKNKHGGEQKMGGSIVADNKQQQFTIHVLGGNLIIQNVRADIIGYFVLMEWSAGPLWNQDEEVWLRPTRDYYFDGDNLIRVRSQGIVEHYTNTPDGLTQTVYIPHKPKGEDSYRLRTQVSQWGEPLKLEVGEQEVRIFNGQSMDLKVSNIKLYDKNQKPVPFTLKLEPQANSSIDYLIVIENKAVDFPISLKSVITSA
jgi:hypothetical protein